MLDQIAGDLDYPMLIVTAAAGGRRDGCLVGFATQTSIDPSRFLVCLSRRNLTCELALGARVLGVHFLGSGDLDLAELFGGRTGHRVDKLARCDWREGPNGVPVLTRPPAWFAGRVLERLDLGDHVGFVLEPGEGGRRGRLDQLGFARCRHIAAGHGA
jgi:flavin reductase (DIM6/NTAB) family NADH-FMN oxidoreductase RutF